MTERLFPDHGGVAKAARFLSAGALVSFATETVYGLGADARNDTAVAEIYAAKGRPSFNPLIVHVASTEAAKELVHWSDEADVLSQFWPGPLTMVLPVQDNSGISKLVTAGLPTLAVRVPATQTARDLLTAFGGPVAAPSANPSGKISPTSADHVLAGLNGKIAAVLDDGPCSVGLESTIIGFDEAPTLLRPGGLPSDAIETVLGCVLARSGDAITAPGQLMSHYAPAAPVRLNATAPVAGEVMLGFADIPGLVTLSKTGDLVEAAANLFEALHQLDKVGKPIAVAPIPQTGLGIAINDRLQRAAAPRG